MDLATNDALALWMEDEGLGTFALLKVTPRPTKSGRKLPASIVMEWGCPDLEYEGDREKFAAWRVTAEGIADYRCAGALDLHEECTAALGDGPNIDVRLEAGGVLTLKCRRLVVDDAPRERFRQGKPRPHHGEAHLEVELGAATLAELRAWLGIPPQLVCQVHRSETVVEGTAPATDVKHAALVDAEGHHWVWLGIDRGRLHVSRGKWATDEAWLTIWASLPRLPGISRISSRDLVSAPADWPAQPPPKPTPQVWPDVYGVTCAFVDLTFAELRACTAIDATHPVAAEGAEVEPSMTLGEAVRAAGGRGFNGVFQTLDARPMVHFRADVVEGGLSFRRARDCDDATWRGVWHAPERLRGVRQRHSRTTQSPPDPWPEDPPTR